MSLSSFFYEPSLGPFSEFTRLFDAACDARNPHSPDVHRRHPSQSGTLSFCPRMDMHESKEKNQVTATFELPGIKKEDITIDVHNNRLIVSGQSIISNTLDDEGYALRERRFGKFTRAVALPVGTKPDEVKASMEDGVLTIKFPRTQPEQEAKRVTIS